MENQTNENGQGLTVVNQNAVTTVIGTNSAKIASTILDSIEKLQRDPKYIPQAEAINSSLKTLVELGKSEIEMMKVSAFLSAK